MTAKAPLFSYLRRQIESNYPALPNRAIPDLIAWALGFKSYASLNDAYEKNKINLDDQTLLQRKLRQWDDNDQSISEADYSLLKNLLSKNKNSAVVNLSDEVEDFINYLNMLLIVYHPDVLTCHNCGKSMVTTVDDIAYVTEAENEDDLYAVLCPDCLSEEMNKPRQERNIFSIDGSYRHV